MTKKKPVSQLLGSPKECPECKGWGVIFLAPGIPNVTKPCEKCHGKNVLEPH